MKICSCCKKEKPYKEFHKSGRRKDGYHVYCKECRRIKYAEDNSPERLEVLRLRSEGKKRCAICKEIKYFSEFSELNTSQDGYRYQCKECRQLIYKEYYYSDIENSRKQAREKTRRWRSIPKNAEYNRQVSRKYSMRNRHLCSERQRLWRNTKSGRIKLQLQLQRRRKRHNESKVILQDWHILLLNILQDGRCGKCKKEFTDDDNYTLDHIVPLSRGGDLSVDNTQLLCRSCNSSKGINTTKYRPSIAEYYAWIT